MTDAAHKKGMDDAMLLVRDALEPAFMAYQEGWSQEADTGSEPDKGDDDDPGDDSITRIKNPVFKDEKTGRGIRIFHTALNIKGAPSRDELFQQYGIQFNHNLTQGNFLDGSKKIGLPNRDLPEPGRVEAAAGKVQSDFCMVDIERWWPADHSGIQPLDDDALFNYIEVGDRFDDAIDDDIDWTFYSTAPHRAWFAALRGGTALQTWMNTNTRAGAILKRCKYVAPSLYTFGSLRDADQWDIYGKANISEALRIGDEMPVVPVLWPFWHPQGQEPIDPIRMLRQMETCLDAGASGFTIFITSTNRKEHAFDSHHRNYFGAIKELIDKRLTRL